VTVACKTLDEATYSEWSARYRRATTDLAEMEKRKSKEDNAIDALMDEIEANLELMGATAIEDKLQEQVPDTIRSLAEAGLKLWVLTGDKQETAINIAWACQLLDHSMRTIVINTDSAQTPEEIRLVLAGHVDSMQIPLVRCVCVCVCARAPS
jgi:phospholipid-transporting ATPase